MSIPLYIITTAYRAENYVKRYVEIVSKEIELLGNVKLYIGIDGCRKTLDEILKIKNYNENIRFFYSEKNLGTYIMKNSLLNKIPQEECLLHFFDVDDIFIPGYIDKYYKECLNILEKSPNFILRSMFLPVDEEAIVEAFTAKGEKHKLNIYPNIREGNFREAIIDILCLLAKNYRSVLDMHFKCDFDSRKFELDFIRKIKKKSPSEIKTCIESLSAKYYSPVSCYMALSYFLKMYYVQNKDIMQIKTRAFLPTEAYGQFFTTLHCIKKLGGFNKYRVDQDFDLLKRASAMGDIIILSKKTLPFFIRSISGVSLTGNKETGSASEYRRKVRSINDAWICQNKLVSDGISCPLTEI